MCGRFSLGASHVQIRHMADYPDIDVEEAEWINEDDFRPRYNIAPRSNAPVIRRNPDNGELVLHTMKWGVVPHWSKHEDLGLNTINARGENLVESGGMWASIKPKKRCAIVCDGYYEWLKKGKERVPHFTHLKDHKLMILAGLYDSVLLEGSTTPLWTFTIVTTDASPSISWLHDRQPVILSSVADFEAWLDTSKGWHSGLVKILDPGEGKELESYAVPKEVGRVGTNSPEFIKPVSERKDGIKALFAKQIAKGKQTPPASPKKRAPSTPAGVSSAPPAASAVIKEEGSSKRELDDDGDTLALPLPSPSSGQSPQKKQKVVHSPTLDVKPSVEAD